MLEVVGLGAEMEWVYEVLVGSRSSDAAELSAVTGLPEQQVRAALSDLERLGLARRLRGRPGHFAAADPSSALDVLLLRREEAIQNARLRAKELSERFREATSRQAPDQLVEVVVGREAVRDRVDTARRGARTELRIFDKPPYAAEPNPPEVEPSGDLLLRRGGSVRTIYEQTSLEVLGRLRGEISTAAARGTLDRVLPELPLKMVLVDDRLGIVPLQAAPTVIDTAVIVHPSGLLTALSALFETLWRVSLPLALDDTGACARPAAPGEQPSDAERHILALLTTGVPDDAIARELGLSERTFRRRVQNLMERLGARTRFQLARQAARRGWLDDDAN